MHALAMRVIGVDGTRGIKGVGVNEAMSINDAANMNITSH